MVLNEVLLTDEPLTLLARYFVEESIGGRVPHSIRRKDLEAGTFYSYATLQRWTISQRTRKLEDVYEAMIFGPEAELFMRRFGRECQEFHDSQCLPSEDLRIGTFYLRENSIEYRPNEKSPDTNPQHSH